MTIFYLFYWTLVGQIPQFLNSCKKKKLSHLTLDEFTESFHSISETTNRNKQIIWCSVCVCAAQTNSLHKEVKQWLVNLIKPYLCCCFVCCQMERRVWTSRQLCQYFTSMSNCHTVWSQQLMNSESCCTACTHSPKHTNTHVHTPERRWLSKLSHRQQVFYVIINVNYPD